MTAKLHSIPCGEKKQTCLWCHELYPCHTQNFSTENCPRVVAIEFFSAEEVHGDGWYVRGVQFRDIDIEAEVEVDDDESS